MTIEAMDAVLNPSGELDCGKTAEQIQNTAGNLMCRFVTADPDLLTPESAAELYRAVNVPECRLDQILLIEDGRLYSLLP